VRTENPSGSAADLTIHNVVSPDRWRRGAEIGMKRLRYLFNLFEGLKLAFHAHRHESAGVVHRPNPRVTRRAGTVAVDHGAWLVLTDSCTTRSSRRPGSRRESSNGYGAACLRLPPTKRSKTARGSYRLQPDTHARPGWYSMSCPCPRKSAPEHSSSFGPDAGPPLDARAMIPRNHGLSQRTSSHR
jgi:hypothetical protein